jgi:hypothetical protein
MPRCTPFVELLSLFLDSAQRVNYHRFSEPPQALHWLDMPYRRLVSIQSIQFELRTYLPVLILELGRASPAFSWLSARDWRVRPTYLQRTIGLSSHILTRADAMYTTLESNVQRGHGARHTAALTWQAVSLFSQEIGVRLPAPE